ncbi:MAG: moderate conductance mechanosensitive channel [Candidatus Atribacteria bacterium]|nr:moderate conductance mechanosensitive channel [Candidatus Atribacteria bacterium]
MIWSLYFPDYPLLGKVLNIILIIGGSYLFVVIASYLVKRLILLGGKYPNRKDAQRRLRTVAPLITSFIKYFVVFFAAILILSELGVDAAAIIAGAGVVGIALGFGAQTLVKDILTGLFLLAEDSLSVGDIVQVGDVTGTVEDIGLRVTRIRPFSGALITIPNGEISRIANFNRGFTRAIVEVGIAYESEVDRAVEIMERVGQLYQEDNPDKVLEPPIVQRIVRLDASSVVLRLILKVAPKEHWGVERDMLYLIKKGFDEGEIEIPYQKQVIYIKAVSPGLELEGKKEVADG